MNRKNRLNAGGGRNRGGHNKSMDVGKMANLLGPINITLGGSGVAASGVSGVDSTGGSGGA